MMVEEFRLFRSAITDEEFKKFALTILGYKAEDQGKTFLIGEEASAFLGEFGIVGNANSRQVFDAVIPEGFYSFRPVLIVTKSFGHLRSQVLKEASKMAKEIRTQLYGNNVAPIDDIRLEILIVTRSSRIIKEDLETEFRDLFHVWSLDDLLLVAREYPIEYNAFLELAISKGTILNQKEAEDIRLLAESAPLTGLTDQNKHSISDVAKRMKTTGISLVLGTGVSMDYNNNLSWDKMANALYDRLRPYQKFNDPKASLSFFGEDNISKTQYAKTNLKTKYKGEIYKLLYPRKGSYMRGQTSLDKCADLANLFDQGRRAVKKIITYNYDDYFEQALKSRRIDPNVLYRESDFIDGDLPVYHVHGFVPEFGDPKDRNAQVDGIVLTEDEYCNCYNDSSDWRVAIQLETFKDDTCLFVGNSIKDPNERRLLYRTKVDKKTHFAIFYTNGLDLLDLAKVHQHFFYQLNIRIIWVQKLSDIPEVLSRIERAFSSLRHYI